MATDYGTDLRALDDIPAADDYVSGPENLAYAQARRLLTPPDGYADCGDPESYESLDLRASVGAHLSEADIAGVQADAQRVLAADERVYRVTATVKREGGDLVASVNGEGDDGPFGGVLAVNETTVARLETT